MARDALNREESCGGHSVRNTKPLMVRLCVMMINFHMRLVGSTWGEGQEPCMLKENLEYEFVKRQQRNYKA